MWYSILVAVYFINNVNSFGATLIILLNLQQSGFHRTTKYITVFTDPPERPCDFHLKQLIPSSANVSLDQLINITSKSNQFNVFLYGDTASLFVIQLPLHLRYHSPGHSSFVKINIDIPQLYVDCHGQRTENITHDHEVVHLKCRKTDERCKWLNIDYEIHFEAIVMNVPIGQRNFGGIVTAVTILVSWIGSYCIARALMRKAAALKNRL